MPQDRQITLSVTVTTDNATPPKFTATYGYVSSMPPNLPDGVVDDKGNIYLDKWTNAGAGYANVVDITLNLNTALQGQTGTVAFSDPAVVVDPQSPEIRVTRNSDTSVLLDDNNDNSTVYNYCVMVNVNTGNNSYTNQSVDPVIKNKPA